MQQIAVEHLLAEDGDQLQTLRVFVFQIGKRLAKHHALATAVAVDQGEMTVRLGGERGGQDGQHWGNA